nr:ATP-binding protein [Bacilli bacterium]
MLETVSEIAQIWDKSLKRIAARLDDSGIYDMLFDQSYIDSIDGANITVVLNSGLGVTLMEKNEKYRALVENAVAETTGSNYSLRFVQKSETKKVPDLPPKQDKNAFFTEAHLNPKYVFENFVQGPSNREAYQAAFMISRNPGQLFNPLLLHSNSGLGKTHLLHALGNAIKEKNPNARVLCVSADEFVDEYVKFAQGYKDDQSLVQYFKHDVDVFLVDDVQFLAKKEKTMEMFFTIFCYLYSAGKQIVITSDQSPVTIDGLDDRLKTRFAQGLV